MTADVDQAVAEYFEVLRELHCGAARYAADACFGEQACLPERAPAFLFEQIYSEGLSAIHWGVRYVHERRRVNSPALDTFMTNAAIEAFQERWTDLEARLHVEGGTA